MVVVQRALDRSRDVRAAAASSDTSVELTHELIGERNVHTHGHKLAHSSLRRGKCSRSRVRRRQHIEQRFDEPLCLDAELRRSPNAPQ